MGSTQKYSWNSGNDSVTALSQLIFSECLETCARRGLLSVLNCTSSPIFLEMNIATAATYLHNIYFIAIIDYVTVDNIHDGSIECNTKKDKNFDNFILWLEKTQKRCL